MENIDKSWKGFYKASGIAWVLASVSLAVGFGLELYLAPALDATVLDRIAMMSNRPQLVYLNKGMFMLVDLSAIIGALGIYHALKQVNRSVALTGVSLMIIASVFDLTVQLSYQASGYLAGQYHAAAGGSLQDGFLAAALGALALGDTGSVVTAVVLGTGIFITGIAMLSGVFSRKLAFLVMTAGILYVPGGLTAVNLSPVFLAPLFISILLFINNMVMFGLRLIAIDREIA